ncbi:hypothetical protein ALP05_200170 [Pseudomonas caricapapayae]|uniref:Uncharacterized protein n=1 Tax=Pseudomonas caricapapayae TaxID=46678 RepID=A0A3M6FAR3_9PSED|nr:hypothetical protein ALP05_200170 [Pseudomonas caricapapayae]
MGRTPEPPEFPSWLGSQYWLVFTANRCFPALARHRRKHPAFLTKTRTTNHVG